MSAVSLLRFIWYVREGAEKTPENKAVLRNKNCDSYGRFDFWIDSIEVVLITYD